jgi:hypothetical protein
VSAALKLESPPARFLEWAYFIGERTTFDKFPLACRLYVVFIVYGSIIFCPKKTRQYKDYANKRWNWTDIQGRSIVYTREEANEMCAGNPLMFKIREPIGKMLSGETILAGDFGFPANPKAYSYDCPAVVFELCKVEEYDTHLNDLDSMVGKLRDTIGGAT